MNAKYVNMIVLVVLLIIALGIIDLLVRKFLVNVFVRF